MIIYPDQARQNILSYLLKVSPFNTLITNFRVKLFVSNTTPGASTILTDFTEMSTLGYTEKVLTSELAGDFTIGLSGGIVKANTKQSWEFSAGAGVTVYGWYMTATIGGINRLICAQRFPTPLLVGSIGDKININSDITAGQG